MSLVYFEVPQRFVAANVSEFSHVSLEKVMGDVYRFHVPWLKI